MATRIPRFRLLLLVTSLAVYWIVSSQWSNIDTYFAASNGILTHTNDTLARLQLEIPSGPDRTITKYLRKIITLDGSTSSPLDDCKPTSQFVLMMPVNEASREPWILQSMDEHGQAKTVGGDEFYVTWKQHTDNGYPDAVALVNDKQDGTYELDFVAPPLQEHLHPIPQGERPLARHGNLTIHFQYTCGIGAMAPPTKDSWTHGGALYKTYSTAISKPPPLRPFQPPTLTTAGSEPSSSSSSLSSYEQVLVFGDSAMRQFVKNASRSFESNIVYRKKRRKPWTTALIQEHLTVLRKQLGRDLRESANKPPHAIALLLGSSIWDVLASTTDKAHQKTAATMNTTSLSFASQPVFQDHLAACRQFIRTVRQEYPNVDVLWKSPSAMHIHVVNGADNNSNNNANDNDEQDIDNGKDGSSNALFNRVRYMSSSRMAHLYRLQRQLMQEELHVPFLDIYEATFLSAAWTFPGDGRHYLPDLHKHMIQWFY